MGYKALQRVQHVKAFRTLHGKQCKLNGFEIKFLYTIFLQYAQLLEYNLLLFPMTIITL